MTDVVEQLRYFANPVCHKAAEEIERLRTALRRIRSLDKKNVEKMAQQIADEALK